MYGVLTEDCSEGTLNLGYLNPGDYVTYPISVETGGTYSLNLRVASGTSSGNLQVESDSTVLGSIVIPNTGGWQSWTDVSLPIILDSGEQNLKFYILGGDFNLNYFGISSTQSLPDLTITDITTIPANPILGDNVRITYTVGNSGSNSSDSCQVAVKVNGTEVSLDSINGLAPGAYTVIENSYSWSAISGITNLEVIVDSSNVVSESNESNNSFQSDFQIVVNINPDLVVSDIVWSPLEPLNGETVQFQAVITNQGTGYSPSGTIHGVVFRVDGATVNWSDSHTTGLAPGESVTLMANGSPTGSAFWIATTGTHTVEAMVDDIFRISESNENNNIKTEDLYVDVILPDLIVSSVDVIPESITEGESVQFSAVIKNSSVWESPYNLHRVGFYINGSLVSYSDDFYGVLINGNPVTVTANSSWTALPGNFTLTAIVDDLNSIEERDEDNNSSNVINLNVTPLPKADLVVSGLAFNPAEPVSGDLVSFKYILTNSGTLNIPAGSSVPLVLYINGNLIDTDYPLGDGLVIGSSIELEFNNSYQMGDDTAQIKIQADPDNILAELDESNNGVSDFLGQDPVGATVSYDTFEAEDMQVSGGIILSGSRTWTNLSAEASGRKVVEMTSGDSINWTSTNSAKGVVVRFSMEDSVDGTPITQDLSLYANGQHVENLTFTNKYSHQYGQYGSDGGEMQWKHIPVDENHHRYFDEIQVLLDQSYPQGTSFSIKWDSNDPNPAGKNKIYIDFVETEPVPERLVIPPGFLDITNYGANGSDSLDDTSAFNSAIADAASGVGNGVWIPEGTFLMSQGTRGSTRIDVPAGVTIQGAGIWYSVIAGDYAGFVLKGGNVILSDFMIRVEETYRSNSSGIPAIEGNAAYSTLKNLWIEHTKVGFWLNEGTIDAVVTGCRIRNTWADGININGGTDGALIEQNVFRNTGDDAMAMWSKSLNSGVGTVANSIFQFNTIQMPTLANGIGIYGGQNNKVKNNLILDIIDNGSGIQYGTNHGPSTITGTLEVSGNKLVRCGSYHHDYDYNIGAIWNYWINSNGVANNLTVNVVGNTIVDSTFSGIFTEEYSVGIDVNIIDNVVDNSGTNALHARGSAKGEIYLENNIFTNSGEIDILNDSNDFVIIQ